MEGHGRPFVVAVTSRQRLWAGFEQHRVDAVADTLAKEAWFRLSVADGSKGPRVYDWRPPGSASRPTKATSVIFWCVATPTRANGRTPSVARRRTRAPAIWPPAGVGRSTTASRRPSRRRPLFAHAVKHARPDKRLRWFVMDEARIGQKGTLTRVWARRGSRPTAVRQTEYEWVCLWAAADPATGASVAMITPTVNTDLMNTFLAGLAGTMAGDEHAVLVLDNAGWHTAKALVVPGSLSLLRLPPYSPELNPAERLWSWLRSHQLGNCVYVDYDELLKEADRAWLTLDAERIKSICACSWIEHAVQCDSYK